jgi:hypothetical protein
LLVVGVFAIVDIAVGRFGQRLGVFVRLECSKLEPCPRYGCRYV